MYMYNTPLRANLTPLLRPHSAVMVQADTAKQPRPTTIQASEQYFFISSICNAWQPVGQKIPLAWKFLIIFLPASIRAIADYKLLRIIKMIFQIGKKKWFNKTKKKKKPSDMNNIRINASKSWLNKIIYSKSFAAFVCVQYVRVLTTSHNLSRIFVINNLKN